MYYIKELGLLATPNHMLINALFSQKNGASQHKCVQRIPRSMRVFN